MKLATYRSGRSTAIGIVDAEAARIFDIAAAARRDGASEAIFASLLALIDADDEGLDLLRTLLAKRGSDADLWVDLAGVELLAPLPEPRQMRDCMSFERHIRQSGRGSQALRARRQGGDAAFQAIMQAPPAEIEPVYREIPIYYITNRFTVVGPATTVLWPRYSEVMDYELEVGIVTRRTRANIPEREATAHIFGYTIFNDFSARDRQGLEMQGRLGPAKGKSFDGSNVLGPWIVTPDELGDPQTLRVEVRVNGETRATGDTSGMLFSFEQILSLRLAGRDDPCGRVLWFRHRRQLLRAGDRPLSRERRYDRAPCRQDRRAAQQGSAPGRRLSAPAEIREEMMTRRLIDISVPLQNDVAADPPGAGPRIEYVDHQQSLPRLLPFFPGLKAEDLPEGQGWAVEQVTLSTHNGTHLDAPWHYHPTMNEGERSWTIDEIPLEWCFQPGVKLDFRHFADGYVATAADVDAELKRIGHDLKPLEIVVVNTAAGAKYGRPDYVASGCGMGAEATLHLLQRGVRLTGTDGWSWDAPFVHTAKRFAQTHDPSIIWEGHKAGRHIGYCHIEKLHNLEALPSTGFMVSCFPVKIERASAGWTRAVAIVDV